jgi:hypothetical protein
VTATRARRRRLGLVLAATIAVLAIGIASFPLIQGANGPGTLDGPALVPRPIVIAFLLGLPAGLAAIAALRGSRAMLVAAGMLCLLQSIVAFSGVTLGFVIPGIVLVRLGLGRASTEPPHPLGRREWLGGVFVVALGIAAWVVPFVTAETVCWVARASPDGNLTYELIPETGSITLDPDAVAGGCDGGVFTLQGLIVGGILAIGALAMAGLSSDRPGPA